MLDFDNLPDDSGLPSVETPNKYEFKTRIVLYKNSSERNRIDKNPFLTVQREMSGVIKNECSIITPIIIINSVNFIDCNYAYIASYNRFYYITDIITLTNAMYELHMEVDVLMSHRIGIYNSLAFIERNEFEYNEDMLDTKTVALPNTTITELQVKNNVFNVLSGNEGWRLVVNFADLDFEEPPT